MTASNLFKYCQPCHGLVLFKHHQPLDFTQAQLSDLLLCAQGWFRAACAWQPSARRPFFLWNCGARAGASQFHGHAQVALSEVSVRSWRRLLLTGSCSLQLAACRCLQACPVLSSRSGHPLDSCNTSMMTALSPLSFRHCLQSKKGDYCLDATPLLPCRCPYQGARGLVLRQQHMHPASPIEATIRTLLQRTELQGSWCRRQKAGEERAPALSCLHMAIT